VKQRSGRIVQVLLVILLMAVLVGPFLVPIPPLEGTFPPQSLADPDSQFIEIGDLSLHVKTRGEGEPVIMLLHGFGASLYSWQPVMDTLAQLGMVIAYDRPAFGLSERPLTWEGQNPYGPEAQVAIVIELLDHYNVQRAILVGHSAGGTVAMRVALERPERVSALILVDPAVYAEGGMPAFVRPLLATPQMRRLGPLFVRQIRERGLKIIETAWHDPSKIETETLEHYQKPLQADNWDRALWEFTLASHDSSLVERLDELNAPTLVITGDDDRIVPTGQSIRLAGELPNAQLVVIDESGHIPHEEQPQVFMDAVMSFMNATVTANSDG
jgi:pimeloyl-ACP methyl ester carboxylesterase